MTASQPDDDDDDGEAAQSVSSTDKASLTVTSTSSGPEILDTIDTVALALCPKSKPKPDPKHGMMPLDPPGDGHDGRRPGRSLERDLGRLRSLHLVRALLALAQTTTCGTIQVYVDGHHNWELMWFQRIDLKQNPEPTNQVAHPKGRRHQIRVQVACDLLELYGNRGLYLG